MTLTHPNRSSHPHSWEFLLEERRVEIWYCFGCRKFSYAPPQHVPGEIVVTSWDQGVFDKLAHATSATEHSSFYISLTQKDKDNIRRGMWEI